MRHVSNRAFVMYPSNDGASNPIVMDFPFVDIPGAVLGFKSFSHGGYLLPLDLPFLDPVFLLIHASSEGHLHPVNEPSHPKIKLGSPSYVIPIGATYPGSHSSSGAAFATLTRSQDFPQFGVSTSPVVTRRLVGLAPKTKTPRGRVWSWKGRPARLWACTPTRGSHLTAPQRHD
jgi:hypothetical protein